MQLPVEALFSSAIKEYLKPTFRLLSENGYDSENILHAISVPPRRYYLRVNLTRISRPKFLAIADESSIHEVYPLVPVDKIQSNEEEPLLNNVVWVPIHGPYSLEVMDKKVYTDKFGAEAVRIGADLFRPGVLNVGGPLEKGEKVSIFVDPSRIPPFLLDTLRDPHHPLFHVANGEVVISTREMNTTLKGVFVHTTDPRYRVFPFKTHPLYERGLISDQNISSNLATEILSEVIVRQFMTNEGWRNAFLSDNYDDLLIPARLLERGTKDAAHNQTKNVIDKKSPHSPLGPHPENLPLILDTCAAPGHKTTALAEWLHYKLYTRILKRAEGPPDLEDAVHANSQGSEDGGARYAELDYRNRKWIPIYAIDRSPRRLSHLAVDRKRLGLGNIRIVPLHLEKIPRKHPELVGRADVVVFDPPCSALGQRPKLFLDRTMDALLDYAKNQRRLLKIVDKLVKSGGILMYNTCTIAVQENEGIVSYALEKLGYKLLDLPPPYDSLPKKGLRIADPLAGKSSDDNAGAGDGADNGENHNTNDGITGINIPVMGGLPYGVLEDKRDLENLIRFIPSINEGSGYFIALLQKEM